jgi:hypothetical protein
VACFESGSRHPLVNRHKTAASPTALVRKAVKKQYL